jgi:hypothetical protein
LLAYFSKPTNLILKQMLLTPLLLDWLHEGHPALFMLDWGRAI